MGCTSRRNTGQQSWNGTSTVTASLAGNGHSQASQRIRALAWKASRMLQARMSGGPGRRTMGRFTDTPAIWALLVLARESPVSMEIGDWERSPVSATTSIQKHAEQIRGQWLC